MESQATLLYRLQTIDLKIAKMRGRLKAIDALLGSDETVARATKEREAAEQALKPFQTRARDLELEIKSVVAKAQATDADLYSGRITNPKALQELQEEIAALKRRQGQLEDDLLETMVEIETHQSALSDADSALQDARTALATTQGELVDERERLEDELAEAEASRAAASGVIEPGSLETYEKLRPRMRGMVVAPLQNEGCVVCGVGQTSMVVNQVRSGNKLVTCGSCGRILADIS